MIACLGVLRVSVSVFPTDPNHGDTEIAEFNRRNLIFRQIPLAGG